MIIGLAGKSSVGKDESAHIINYLCSKSELPYKDWKKHYIFSSAILDKFENKKFADRIKDIICLLIGCTRTQLEDRDFKENSLGEDWNTYVIYHYKIPGEYKRCGSAEEAINELSKLTGFRRQNYYIQEEVITPRLLMQLLGTEFGRKLVHPNLWVSSLFVDYKLEFKNNPFYHTKNIYDVSEEDEINNLPMFPNWIISDVRFPNEIEAIKKRDGILIKLVRDTGLNSTHGSEIALDNYPWTDYVIDNNGTIEELVEKLREILIKENII